MRTGVQPGHLEAEKSHSWDPDEGLELHISNKDLSCDPSTQEAETREQKFEARMDYIERSCQKEEKMKKRKERGGEGRNRDVEKGDGKGKGRNRGEERLDGGQPTEVRS